MTLTNLLPVRLGWRERPIRKHRAIDENQRLKHQLAGAKLLIQGLYVQLNDKDHKHAATVARIDERHGEVIRGLEDQIAELERSLQIGVLAESAAAKTQEMPIVTRVLPLHQSPLATTDPGHVRAWVGTRPAPIAKEAAK